jgi:hypothetical protein
MLRLLAVLILFIVEGVLFVLGVDAGFNDHEYAKAAFYIALSVTAQISIIQKFVNDDIKEIKEKLNNLK